MIQLNVPIINKSGFTLPEYKTEGSAGMDLRASLVDELVLTPGNTYIVHTGLYVAVPQGFEMQIRSRSGLSTKGIIVMNAPGTIDSDYRGEIGVILSNQSDKAFCIKPGERIAQAVFAEVPTCNWLEVSELPDTKRGEGGFGHTGM